VNKQLEMCNIFSWFHTSHSVIWGVYKFFKNLGETFNLQASGDVKQVRYWGSTILEWLNIIVIWHFLLGARETIRIFVFEDKSCSIHAENIGCHHTKCSQVDDLTSGICAPMTDAICFYCWLMFLFTGWTQTVWHNLQKVNLQKKK
jgi:hypothetical protein